MFSLVPAPGRASFCQHLLQRRGPSAVCGDFSLKKVVGVRRRSFFPKRAALATAVRKRAHNASAALPTLCGLSFLWQPAAILLAKGFRRQDKVRFVPTCFCLRREPSHTPASSLSHGGHVHIVRSAANALATALVHRRSFAGQRCGNLRESCSPAPPGRAEPAPQLRASLGGCALFFAPMSLLGTFLWCKPAPAVGEAVRARPFCGFAAEVWSGRLFGRCFPAAGSRAPFGGSPPFLCLRGGRCPFGSTGRRCEPRTSCRFFCEGRRHVHSAAAPLPQGGIAPPFWPLTRYRPLQVGIF